MHDQERLTPEESEFADALGALLPTAPELSFQRVLMEAQQRRWRTQVLVWRGVAAVLAGGLITSLLLRPQGKPGPAPATPAEVVRQANHPMPPKSVPAPASQRPPMVLIGDDYLALRSRVVAFGINALPAATPAIGEWAPIRPLDPAVRGPEPHADIQFFGPLWRGGHS